MAGLAAAWHNNLDLLGAPKAHTTAAATNSWGTGSPATGVPVDDFSGALTGQVTMGSGGGTLAVNTSPSNVETSGAKIRVDDEVVVDTSVSTYRSRIRADGPIASWRLGEAAGAATAVDQTATANGSYVGAITRGAASGVPLDTDKSVTNAAGGRVVVPHTAALNLTGELTIEAWVRPTSTAHYHMIVAKSVGDGGSNNNYEFRLNPSLAPEFVQYQNGAFRLVTGASTAALGAWSHVVVTKRFDTVTFWINGVRAGTGTIGYSPPPSTNTRPLYIGARDDIGTTGYSYDFEGGLDDVALYGRALTEAEVGAHASIYARTVAADSPREWVRLNEATGQSIRDSGPVGGSIATPEGGVTAGAPGLVGDGSPAMSFDGVSGDVRFLCCRDFLRWADGFSLEAWVKPTAANADGRILVMTNPTGTNGLTLSRVGTTNTLAFTVNVAGANTTITALNALPLNTTSHLGVTVTKTGAATLFRNGAVIATGTVPLPATVLRETSYLGRSPAGNFWKGTIDEVAVYDSPLPPGRFAVHYAAGTGGAVGTISSGTIPAGDHRLSAEYRAGIGSATLTLIGTNLVGGLRPAYGLPTSSVDPDGKQTTTAYSSPQLAQPSMTTADPAGLALTTTFGYEPATGAGNYARRVSRTLPANNAWTYAYYGTTQTADNPCTGTVEAINQAAAQRTRTGPAPSGAGSERVEETVYDAGGRAVASRISTAAGLAAAPWTCATFDDRDRPTNTTIPARGAEPARTVTSNWAVGGNPLVTFLSDATGTITTTVDLLGRVISATDVWGKTTTTTYDQPGRVTDTASPQGLLHVDYDPAGRPTAQKLGGALVATPAYDSAGRLASVSYPSGSGNAGNGTSLAVGLDTLGRTNSFGWKQAGGILDLATDAVTRSLAGRINDESADLLDANPAGDNFSYDGAGRLTDAWSLAHHYTYSFATGTCGSANAGKNANVTSATDNLTTTTFCYDSADWMTSSTAPGAGTAGSDDHGNTTSLDATTLAYDGADRHVTTNAGSTSVRYQRDALDRIVARTENGQTVRYAFANGGDSPVATLDTANTVTEAQVSLLGGAMITTRAGGNVWSYPNIHGDTVATADAAGAKTGGGVAYDPYGNQISASGADNSGSNFDYGWLGAHKRGTDHASGVPTVIEMGARPYLPVVGRFLSVDPIEGGCANSYTYVHGDPINELDLSGTKTCAGPANLVLRSYWKTVGSGVAFGLLQAGLRWTGEYRVKVRMLSGVWGAFGYADSVSGKRGHTGSINPFQTLTFKFAGTLGPATRTLTVNWAALPIYDYRSVSYTNAFQWQIDIKIYYWEAVQPRCS
jgi:RHS repeat-associated protein